MKSAVVPVPLSVSQCPGDVMVKMIVTVEKMKKTVVRRSVLSGLSQRPFCSKKGGHEGAVDLTCLLMTSLSAVLVVLPNCPQTLREVRMVIDHGLLGCFF